VDHRLDHVLVAIKIKDESNYFLKPDLMSPGVLKAGDPISLSISQIPSIHLPPSNANFYIASPYTFYVRSNLCKFFYSSGLNINMVQLAQLATSSECFSSLSDNDKSSKNRSSGTFYRARKACSSLSIRAASM
jgi:hypothetical protein